MIRTVLLSLLLIWSLNVDLNGQSYELESPDSKIRLKIDHNSGISWTCTYDGKTVLSQVEIAMHFNRGVNFGSNPKVLRHRVKSGQDDIRPGVSHKDSHIIADYKQLTIEYQGNYQLEVRAYNDGLAYRFVDQAALRRNVYMETVRLNFPKDARSLFPKEVSMYSHNERYYLDKSITELDSSNFCSLPVLFKANDVNVLFTETALHDYPGMFLRASGSTTLKAIFPKFVLKAVDSKRQADRNQDLVEKADYIAQTNGQRAYPWRLFVISPDDRDLVESNLSYQLAEAQAVDDVSWIKPGKVAWDWYNANNLYGVDFEAGLNTASYKYYIDVAAKYGVEYVILDEGWTKSTTEILDFNPDMDVPELIRYGKEKGVELILWVLWKPLDANMDQILNTYKSWGVSGIKVDFMQRNDQYMVSSYEKIAAACAKLELLVDYHGSFKPSGLRRKYPNVVNYEGVKGAENNKWSKDVTPEHNVTIPFIRMVAGPLDYTPGAMVNKQKRNFSISFTRPSSLGTRAHQVAMYVIYEAPLQMICENPARLMQERETVDFISRIPTTWDETRVLHGKIGDYIAIARRKGNQWFIGAMTDWSERSLDIDLSFLDAGPYTMEVFQDGINANRFAEDYTIKRSRVDNTTKFSAKLAKGGGWSAIITQSK